MECLVTRLKGVVNNDSLPLLGVLRIKAIERSETISDSKQYRIGFAFNKPTTIRVDGNGYFATSAADLNDESKRYTEFEVPVNANETYFYFKHDTYNIYIDDKYALTKIFCSTETGSKKTIFEINVEDFEGCQALNRMFLTYCGEGRAIGTINAKAAYLPTINGINIGGTSIISNTAVLGKAISLTNLTVYLSESTGSFEEFVSTQCENGNTSGEIPNSGGTLVKWTFGGVKQRTGGTGNSVISWVGTEKIIVIYSDAHVYAKGATAEEIAAWENAGKTVHVIE